MADQFENQLPQKSDAKWVRALDASGNPILISKEDLASVVGELIGVATESKDGLLQAGTFRYLGSLEDRSLDNIGSGYGYSYGAGGAGIYGIFLSFFADCKLQFKCNYADGSLFTRTYNQEVKKWSEWKRII